MMWSKVTGIINHSFDPRATIIIADPSSSLKQQPLVHNPSHQPPPPGLRQWTSLGVSNGHKRYVKWGGGGG